jgi:hypothetical protein
MADHIFGHENWYVLPTIMDSKCMPNKRRKNRRTARPGFDNPLLTLFIQLIDFIEQLRIRERTLLERSSHYYSLPDYASDHCP